MSFAEQFLAEAAQIISRLDTAAIEQLAQLLAGTRDNGDAELLHPPADPLPRLEHRDVGAAESEVARCGEAGEAGAEHEDVGQRTGRSARA